MGGDRRCGLPAGFGEGGGPVDWWWEHLLQALKVYRRPAA